MLASEFGLKDIIIQLIPSAMTNAMTFPITTSIECSNKARVKANLIVYRTGFKYKTSAGYVIMTFIFSNLFLNPKLSAGEVLAVILHEIGHNFQLVLDNKVYFLHDYTTIASDIGAIYKEVSEGELSSAALTLVSRNIIIPTILSNKNKATIAQKMRTTKSDFVINISDLVFTLFSAFSQGSRWYNSIYNLSILLKGTIDIPTTVIKREINNMINFITNPTGYRNEKLSDNFATIYGYGPELSRALLIMDLELNKDYDIVQQIPLVGILLRNLYGLLDLLTSVFRTHPESFARAVDQIKYLKEELDESDLSPKAKAIIAKEIKEIEDNMDSILKDPQLDKRWNLFSYAYAIHITQSGSDLSGKILAKDSHEQIRNTYNKAIKNIK